MRRHHHWLVILSRQKMWSWCQQIPSSLSTVKINQPSRLQRSGQRSQCQGSQSAVHQLPDHWSSMPSWHHFHQRGWTCVICQRMSRCSHQASSHQATRSTSSSSWTLKLSVIGSSSMMQSSSSGISIMFFKFLVSRSHQEVISSIGRFMSHFRMPSIT